MVLGNVYIIIENQVGDVTRVVSGMVKSHISNLFCIQ